jgi:DUF4097 and DUF4098 domain-containing protein YvlB
MSARKPLLLILILGFGGMLEGWWAVRNHLDVGAAGCRILEGRFVGPSFSFEETKELDAPAALSLEVQNAFGAVSVVEGQPGRVEVTLRKAVFLRDEAEARAFASRIVLSTSLEGSNLKLGTNRASLDRDDAGTGFETHIHVAVPPGTVVKVKNEHGAVEVSDVAAADVAGSFDSIEVERVAGDAKVEARHGSVRVADVGGALSLSARFGDVSLHGIKGTSKLDVEHGDISAEQTSHLSIAVKQGDARVSAVQGDLELLGEHSAARVEGVTGRASVKTSFNDVVVRDAGGDARLIVDHGGLHARNVKGTLYAELSFGDGNLEDVAGAVDVRVDHGGIHAKSLLGGAKVRAEGDDVVIENFRGPIDVEVRRGSAELVPAGPLTEPVSVTSTSGGIRLEVPAGSRFELLATSHQGEVQADLPDLAIKEKSASRVAASLGGGTSQVTLAADHGDVVLTPRAKLAER